MNDTDADDKTLDTILYLIQCILMHPILPAAPVTPGTAAKRRRGRH